MTPKSKVEMMALMAQAFQGSSNYSPSKLSDDERIANIKREVEAENLRFVPERKQPKKRKPARFYASYHRDYCIVNGNRIEAKRS